MKSFFRTLLAVIIGILLTSIIGFILLFGIIGAIGTSFSSDKSSTTIPSKAVLTLDMSTISLAEQTQEADIMASLQSFENPTDIIGIYDAVSAIEKAAIDPAIKYIYMKPDGAAGGIADMEEFRGALEHFRTSGKPVISYIESPTNAGYYLASVSDKIYMTPLRGGMVQLTGLSSQLFFLKDILDKLGVNIQLIRHGKYKSAGEMYIRNSISDENREQYEELLGSIWGGWTSQIASSRGISADDFNAALDELKLVVPEDFIETKLVDELISKEELDARLCSLFGVDKVKDIKTVSLAEYAAAKVTPNYRAKEKIAVIYADGQIMDGQTRQGYIDGDTYARIIKDVRRDSSIKAVVFRVNSPGGTVLSAEKIKAEIDLLRKEKPVIASFGDYAASGGYWISNSCDRIFANAGTLTGSIGVFSTIPDFSKTIKDIAHVGVAAVNTNKHSDMYSVVRPLDNDEKAYMQASVEDIYDRFTGMVAEGRNMTQDAVDEIAQGRVWSGTDALKIGLVDEIGTLGDALAYAASVANSAANSNLENWQIVNYPKPKTAVEEMMEMINGKQDETIFSGTPLEAAACALSRVSESKPTTFARLPFEIVIK